jgi:GH25 family lysozyme M1 (1,4-beta-N-acetylmuramidase)
MLKVIDISNWQGGINLPALLPNVGAVVCKATDGVTFVDSYCDGWVQQCINSNKPWGFYHFASNKSASEEAEFFVRNCQGYFRKGIPILDWEGKQSVGWVNTFVSKVHSLTGVWPWIYGNPWRFNQGGVEPDCARWVAKYPAVTSPSFELAETWSCPEADGNVVAWQFCSDGRVNGYDEDLDCSLFYGNVDQWKAYAKGDNRDSDAANGDAGSNVSASVLENDQYKITVERK